MPAKFVFKALGLSLLAMVLVLFGVGQILADRWQVETTRTVHATAEQVGALVLDLREWPGWAAMIVDLGPPTQQHFEGQPGQVGQRLVWNGPMGEASLQVVALQADAVRYTWTVHQSGEEEARQLSSGSLEWRADGKDCRLVWREERQLNGLIERWFAWFGAMQEAIRKLQRTGLEGLAQKVEAGSAGTGR